MSSRSSIFSFSTVKSAPSLKVFILTMVFITIMMAVGKTAFFNRDNELILLEGGSGVAAFKKLDTQNNSVLPNIVVAGDSRNIDGIIANTLIDSLKCPVAKISIAASVDWEPLKILHLYSDHFKKTKILLFDLDAGQFFEQGNFLQRGNAYVLLRERGDTYPGYINAHRFSWKNDAFPVRLSVNQVVDIIIGNIHYSKNPDSWMGATEEKKGDSVISRCTEERLKESLRRRKEARFNDRILPALWQLLDECTERNIIVVFNRVPTFEGRNFMHGPAGIPPELCNTEIDRKFEEVYQELQKRDNVVFLGFRRFSDIGVMDDEEELFADCHHLLPKGAEIYTKWLAEELMRNPKTRAALERE